MPVPQNCPLDTWPSTSSWPNTCTLAAVTGLLLSATLKRTLDSVPAGKAKLEIPERVVTASDTEIGACCPSSTRYWPGDACSSWCEKLATVVAGEVMAPSVGRIGTS